MASNLPTPAKTWQFNVNNAQAAQGTSTADTQLLWLNILNALLGFSSSPWTVLYSCDATTSGTVGDGVNRITSASKIITKSWVVLKQSGIGSNFQLKIGWNPGGLGAYTATIGFSPSAGYTGGSKTVLPTATDERIVANAQTVFNMPGGGSTDYSCRWSVMQSSDGQCTRIFASANGVPMSIMGFEKLGNATPGYDNSGLVYWSAANPPGMGNLASNTNSVAATCSIAYESAAQLSIASEVDGNYPMLPIGLVGTTVGARGRWGTMQDMWIGSTTTAVGDTYPGSSETPQAQFVQLSAVSGSQIIVPWNNGAFNLS